MDPTSSSGSDFSDDPHPLPASRSCPKPSSPLIVLVVSQRGDRDLLPSDAPRRDASELLASPRSPLLRPTDRILAEDSDVAGSGECCSPKAGSLPQCCPSAWAPLLCLVLLLLSSPSLLIALCSWWPWQWMALPQHHPLVFFPAYATSRLKVTLTNQTFSQDCPASGSFEFFAGHFYSWGMPEDCVMQSLRILYKPSAPDLQSSFSSQPGVSVEVADFGHPSCAPYYTPYILALQEAGLKPGHTLFVACYDFRTSPHVDVTSSGFRFLPQAQRLVEEAFQAGGRLQVYLACHSNGCPMALALLQAMEPHWVKKHIRGIIGYAGNWAGQGSVYSSLFTGVSFRDFSTPMPSAAFTLQTWPAIYWTLAQPWIYKDSEVIVRDNSTGKAYSTDQHEELFRDANIPHAHAFFSLFNSATNISNHPQVDAYMFSGSRQRSPVGAVLPNLTQGVQPLGFEYGLGDGDQEAMDNESVKRWARQPGFKFEFVDVGRVQHALVPYSLHALFRTLQLIRTSQGAEVSTP